MTIMAHPTPSVSGPPSPTAEAFMEHGRSWDYLEFCRNLGLELNPRYHEAYTCLARLTDLLEEVPLVQLEPLFTQNSE